MGVGRLRSCIEDGLSVGSDVGPALGCAVRTTVGILVPQEVDSVGNMVGSKLGPALTILDGNKVGGSVKDCVVPLVGVSVVGMRVGSPVGPLLGAEVGTLVGMKVGSEVGPSLGAMLGT